MSPDSPEASDSPAPAKAAAPGPAEEPGQDGPQTRVDGDPASTTLLPWVVGGLVMVAVAVAVWMLVGPGASDPVSPSFTGDTTDSPTIEGALGPDGFQAGSVIFVDRSGAAGRDGRIGFVGSDGARIVLDRACTRVAIAEQTGACLAPAGPALPDDHVLEFFDAGSPSLETLGEQIGAFPGRLNVSPDGQWVASTTWIIDNGYKPLTNRRMISSIDSPYDDQPFAALESFTVLPVEDRHNDTFRQFWSASFAPDSDEFWVSGRFEGQWELFKGTMTDRFLEPTGLFGVEPQVSPDGRLVAFLSTEGALMAHDIGDESTIEIAPGPIEDQVSWLDEDTLLFTAADDQRSMDQALFEGGDGRTFSVWSVDVRPGSEPTVFLANASSAFVYQG